MIQITDQEYFKFLLKLNPTEKRNLCNYIMVIWLLHLQKSKHFNKFTKLACIEDLREKLILPLNIIYYGYIYQPQELKNNAEIQILFRKTRDNMIKMVEQRLTYNDASRWDNVIKPRIYNITLNVGNMPRSMSQCYFDILYGDLPNLQVNNMCNNTLNLLKHRTSFELINLNRTHFIGLDGREEDIDLPVYDKLDSKMLILPFVDLQPPIYHHSYHPIFKWPILSYLLTKSLHSTFLSEYDHFDEWFLVDVAYQFYVAEQGKHQLQPDFTKISWEKLFFLNLAQYHCGLIGYTYLKYFIFPRRFSPESQSFSDAFQCKFLKKKKDLYTLN